MIPDERPADSPARVPGSTRRTAIGVRGVRGIRLLLIVIGLLAPPMMTQAATGPLLARDGASAYRISLAPAAGPMQQHAASELATFVERVTGATLPVESGTPADAPAIRLRVNRESDLGSEAFTIRTRGERVEITGGGPRGLLYGVYYFLERYLGVRWFGPDYTLTPHRPTLRLPVIDVREAPALAYREVFTREADDPAYAARNRLNGRSGHRLAGADSGLAGTFVPLRRLPIFRLVPPERHRESHPEYYGGGQLRFANPEVRRIAVAAARKALTRWPQRRSFVLIEHADRSSYYRDGRDGELIRRHGAPSAAYVDFVRAIAEAVADTHPEVTVLAQAYLWSRQPPADMPLPENMGVMFSAIERDFGKPLTAPVNRAAVEDLRGWAQLTQRIVMWRYITNFAGYLQPYPNLDTLGPDLSLLGGNPAIAGLFAQGAYNTVGGEFSVLRTWVLAKLAWNPQRDAAALVDEFLDGYFGAAAPYIDEYLAQLHRTAERSGGRLGDKVPATAGYLTPELLRRADRLFARAERAVAADPVRLRHVQTARLTVDYAILATGTAGNGAGWVSRDQRLARFAEYLDLAGVTAYREGRGNPPARLLQQLAIERREPSLPVPCGGLPAGACRTVQDDGFDLAGGARLVADAAASDGAVATMSGERRAWGIQLPLERLLPAEGKWRIYISVRTEGGSDSGAPALHTGVYPGRKRAVSQAALGEDAFRSVEIPGLWQGGSDRYVWVAPSGAASLEAIFVDRMFAVRQDAP